MTDYRETPVGGPLLWATKRTIFAIEPATGALRWRRDISDLRRLFRVGSRVYVLTVSGVTCLDINSGQPIGEVALGFVPTAGIVAGDRLFVAGPDGAAALHEDGTLLWRAKREFGKGLTLQEFFRCQGRNGADLWAEPTVAAGTFSFPGLLFEDQVAQPDLDSK
ncbi:MAG: PQQ-binding-like beta-propeller repeat protein [Deltaproteobacteria bacterium]|nr:PQQ-binding-like beta-propeller repeat protein [Deltaproteobacteria bacterium]